MFKSLWGAAFLLACYSVAGLAIWVCIFKLYNAIQAGFAGF